MDFRYRLSAFIAVFFGIILLSACSDTKNASAPVILGDAQSDGLIDVFYEHEFGADSGDGILQYSIVSGPEWLNIENLNDTRFRFRIYGVPTLPAGVSLDDFAGETYNISLKVTDGTLSSTKTFPVAITKNIFEFDNKTLEPIEGNILEALDPLDFSEDCDIPSNTPHEVEGKTAYPFLIKYTLKAPAETPITLHYTLTTTYDKNKAEDDTSNLKKAHPGVDYLDEDGTIIIKPGVTRCVFSLDFFDDAKIESTEKMRFVIDGLESGFVVFPAGISIDIIDDEPEVTFDTETVVMSFGDDKDYKVSLSEKSDLALAVNIFVDNSSNISINENDYIISIGGESCNASDDLTLNTCIASFAAGITEVDFNVKIIDDSISTDGDESLIIRTSVSNFFKLDPIIITINEWIDDEVVATSGGGESAGSIIVDSDGNVVTMLQSDGVDSDVELVMNSRSGSSTNFLSTGNGAIASDDLKAEFTVGLDYTRSTLHRVAAVVNTEGAFAPFVNKNKKDILIKYYTRATGDAHYDYSWTLQLGGSEEDIALGVELDSVGNAFVFGYTEGTLDIEQANGGLQDAFVAKIDAEGTLKWVKMISTNGNDQVTGVKIISKNIYVTGTTTGVLEGVQFGAEDSFLIQLDPDGKLLSTAQFGTAASDKVIDMVGTRENLWLTGQSQGNFAQEDLGSGFDPSAIRESEDVFFLNFTLSGDLQSTLQFGDSVLGDDASAIGRVGETAFIGATTFGEFKEGVNLGGSDAVLSGVNSIRNTNKTLWHKQFGTSSDDRLIDMAIFGSNKIMLLWETLLPGGGVEYKVTPFSSEGAQLTVKNDSAASL